mgnify:FL=1
MGFNFEKRIDCTKCKTKMSYFKTSDGSYYKCSQCNDVIIKE